VYRDKRGKKLDMLSEFMRVSAAKEGKEQKLARAAVQWGRGSVQKEQYTQSAEQLKAMATVSH
jgi:hypothetical protein